eukprot:Lithocolla_globosa_v1_NODE_2211_length_2108_cov_7.206527.p2 type:complete len:188 gc:universal NODE_2211_length_2108_cov_7.206527:1521-2084(+)
MHQMRKKKNHQFGDSYMPSGFAIHSGGDLCEQRHWLIKNTKVLPLHTSLLLPRLERERKTSHTGKHQRVGLAKLSSLRLLTSLSFGAPAFFVQKTYLFFAFHRSHRRVKPGDEVCQPHLEREKDSEERWRQWRHFVLLLFFLYFLDSSVVFLPNEQIRALLPDSLCHFLLLLCLAHQTPSFFKSLWL